MGKRTQNQRRRLEARTAARRAAQQRPGGKSNYARKSRWLHAHGEGRWGFDIPEPKPWRIKR